MNDLVQRRHFKYPISKGILFLRNKIIQSKLLEVVTIYFHLYITFIVLLYESKGLVRSRLKCKN